MVGTTNSSEENGKLTYCVEIALWEKENWEP